MPAWAIHSASSPSIVTSKPRSGHCKADPKSTEANGSPRPTSNAKNSNAACSNHRDAFIAAHPDVPVFRIEFAELTTYPEEVIKNLIEFLGIEPTEEEIASAIDHVNPDLRKHG